MKVVALRGWHFAAVVALVGALCTGIVWQAGPAAAIGGGAGWGWTIGGGLTIGTEAEGVAAGLAPGAIRSFPLCAASGPRCAAFATAGVLAIAATATCATIDQCHDTVIPWIKNQLGVGGGDKTDYVGKTDCTDFPAGQCNSPQWYGSLSWYGTPTNRGMGFQTSAASFPGNTPYIIVKYTCSNGFSDQYGITAAPSQTYTVPDVCGTGTLGGIGHIRIMSGANAYKSGTWDPLLWGNDLEATFAPVTNNLSTATATLTCQRPNGTQYDVDTITVDPKEALRVGHCDPGDTVIGVKGGAADAQGNPLAGGGFTIDLRPKPEDLTNYPLCAGNACSYQVWLNGQPCTSSRPGCSNWTETWKKTPSTVQCHYGPYTVPTDLCSFMERAYEGQKVPVTIPNTDGDPNTYSTPAPAGKPSTQPSPSPSPSKPANPTPEPSPTPPSDPSLGMCGAASKYNLGPVQPQTARLVSVIAPMFGVTTVYGWRKADAVSDDHPDGVAADFMVNSDTAKGASIASYVTSHAASLGVQYVIWQQHIWNIDRADEGWRLMADRGSPTANHMDHVHVTVKDNASYAGLPCSVEPAGDNSDSECFPSGWTWRIYEVVTKPIGCALRAAFVPDQAVISADVEQLKATWTSKPPGSLVAAVTPVVTGLGSGWGEGCSQMPDFSMNRDGSLRLPCQPSGAGPGSAIYITVQGGMVIMTAIYVWHMIAAGISAKATGS